MAKSQCKPRYVCTRHSLGDISFLNVGPQLSAYVFYIVFFSWGWGRESVARRTQALLPRVLLKSTLILCGFDGGKACGVLASPWGVLCEAVQPPLFDWPWKGQFHVICNFVFWVSH